MFAFEFHFVLMLSACELPMEILDVEKFPSLPKERNLQTLPFILGSESGQYKSTLTLSGPGEGGGGEGILPAANLNQNNAFNI